MDSWEIIAWGDFGPYLISGCLPSSSSESWVWCCVCGEGVVQVIFRHFHPFTQAEMRFQQQGEALCWGNVDGCNCRLIWAAALGGKMCTLCRKNLFHTLDSVTKVQRPGVGHHPNHLQWAQGRPTCIWTARVKVASPDGSCIQEKSC